MGAFLVVTLLFIAMAGLQRADDPRDRASRAGSSTRRTSASPGRSRSSRRWRARCTSRCWRCSRRTRRRSPEILRENNRFNEALAKLDAAGLPEQHRARRAGPQLAGRGDGGGRRHGQRDPRPHPRPGHARPARSTGADRRGDHGARGEPRRRRAAPDGAGCATASPRPTAIRSITTAAFAVAAVVLAWLCGFVISWSFIVPVREAQGFLARVAAGDFTGRIDVPNGDEFGALAERMNLMSARAAAARPRSSARPLPSW